MINFSDLKFIIIKNCKTVDNTDIGSRFGFTIDVEKLEKALNEKSDLHVVGFSPVIESRVPNITEIQPISEYVYKKVEINTIFNGSTNIATFRSALKPSASPTRKSMRRPSPWVSM